MVVVVVVVVVVMMMMMIIIILIISMCTIISTTKNLSFSCQALTMGMYMQSVCSSVYHRVRIALFSTDVYAMSNLKPSLAKIDPAAAEH